VGELYGSIAKVLETMGKPEEAAVHFNKVRALQQGAATRTVVVAVHCRKVCDHGSA
jgi:hypothetical protein